MFGREIPQVLLLHANALNAERFGAVADALVRRGYRFISLDEALQATQAMELTRYASTTREGECHGVDATERLEELVAASGGRVRLAAQDRQLNPPGVALLLPGGFRWRPAGRGRRLFPG